MTGLRRHTQRRKITRSAGVAPQNTRCRWLFSHRPVGMTILHYVELFSGQAIKIVQQQEVHHFFFFFFFPVSLDPQKRRCIPAQMFQGIFFHKFMDKTYHYYATGPPINRPPIHASPPTGHLDEEAGAGVTTTNPPQTTSNSSMDLQSQCRRYCWPKASELGQIHNAGTSVKI